MKKALKWIVVFAGIVAIVGIAVVAKNILRTFLQNSVPAEIRVEITGTPVDNEHNNYLSNLDAVGNLVRIGDKLYYNYYGGYETYGLYEISAEGAERIYWNGYVPVLNRLGFEPTLYPIREYDGKLLMNTKLLYDVYGYNETTHERELQKAVIQTYREATQSFEEDAFFCDIADIRNLMYQQTFFGFVYESFDDDSLWVYADETGTNQLVSEYLHSFYVTGEHIYYIIQSKLNAPFVLHVLDWNRQTDSVVCQWTEYSYISYFFIEENNLIFMANSKESVPVLCKLDLNNPAPKETVLYALQSDSSVISSWNVWNGTAYLCSKDGLVACDLETGTYRVLCDKKIISCDIVDDTWVYFV